MDRFTFYRSYYECLKDCEDNIRHEVTDAILRYCFDDVEPEFKIKMSRAIWVLIKPILDNSKKQSANGVKAYKETKESTKKPNKSQTKAKQKPQTIDNEQKEETNPPISGEDQSPIFQDERFVKFNEWMLQYAPYCANQKNMKQLTESEFLKLVDAYSSVNIANVILNLENRKDKRKNYTNLYRTLINWLKQEYGEPKLNQSTATNQSG